MTFRLDKFVHEVGPDGRVAILARTFCELLKLDAIHLWYDSSLKTYIVEYNAASDFDPAPLIAFIAGSRQPLAMYDLMRTVRTQGE